MGNGNESAENAGASVVDVKNERRILGHIRVRFPRETHVSDVMRRSRSSDSEFRRYSTTKATPQLLRPVIRNNCQRLSVIVFGLSRFVTPNRFRTTASEMALGTQLYSLAPLVYTALHRLPLGTVYLTIGSFPERLFSFPQSIPSERKDVSADNSLSSCRRLDQQRPPMLTSSCLPMPWPTTPE